jgi:cysteine desulfurase/selenocysteine lyase
MSLDRIADVTSIENIREQMIGVEMKVPLLDGTHRTYVNFDNAASTPCLRTVRDKIDEFLHWYSSVHRGAGFKSQLSTHIYEEARRVVLDFIGGDEKLDTVIFGKNSTEALNKAASRFPFSGEHVVLTSTMEHHSNDLPWRAAADVVHIDLRADGSLDMGDLKRKLEEYSGRVDLVAITGGSNVTGYINPIYNIADMAHAAGALILVDAAQYAPHRAIDMLPHDDPCHLDFVVMSAHKMYAPFGTGALIGPRQIFESGAPDLVGGGTVDIVTLTSVEWTEPPEKEEAGSPNVVGALAMAESLLTLQEIGLDAIAVHEAELTTYALAGLADIEGVSIFGDSDPSNARNRLGVIPIAVSGVSHYLLAAILSTEFGIGVRNGCFCAHPYVLKLADISEEAAHRHQEEIHNNNRANLPGFVRISFGMYNTLAEVDILLDALAKIVHEDYRGTYVQDARSGEFHEEGYQPDLERYFSLRDV